MGNDSFVLRRDITPVSVRVRGHGPGVILVPGGFQTAADFDKLAEYLAETCTTIVVDRRGRGSSSDLTPLGGLDAEANDILQIAKAMDARQLFGLSSGALIVVRAAQIEPAALDSIALFEPPLVTPGFEEAFDWTDEVRTLLEAGQSTTALARMISVVVDHPMVRLLPQPVLRTVAKAVLRWGRGADGEPLSDLLPTFQQDALIVRDAHTLLSTNTTIPVPALLLSGDRVADPLTAALDALAQHLPSSLRLHLRNAGHLAATNKGRPRLVADHLGDFFARHSL